MEFEIDGKMIGDGHPVYFIAEAGVNHNGEIDKALQLVDAACGAGADAVKFQTFTAAALNTKSAPKSEYHVQTTGSDDQQTWYDLLRSQELSRDQHERVIDHCRQRGITFLSTPYDHQSVDLLTGLDISAYKVASTDTSNTPLLRYIAAKGKPVILSSAMCSMDDVVTAVDAVRGSGCNDIGMLQCTGNYPSRMEDANLRVLDTFRSKLSCVVGYSDHTPGLVAPIAASTLGAAIIEKHFTLDKTLPGPDHRMSLDPTELAETVEAIAASRVVLGSSEKVLLPSEVENRQKLRKSIVAARDLAAGETITEDMLTAKRPGTELLRANCRRS